MINWSWLQLAYNKKGIIFPEKGKTRGLKDQGENRNCFNTQYFHVVDNQYVLHIDCFVGWLVGWLTGWLIGRHLFILFYLLYIYLPP